MQCAACILDGMSRMSGVVGSVGQLQGLWRMVVELRGSRGWLRERCLYRCGPHGHGIAQQAPEDQQQDQDDGQGTAHEYG